MFILLHGESMDREERIFNALCFIEECLPISADLKEIAKRANMSRYHFHRIFRDLVGEAVGKYCQRRRLTLAAECLLNSNLKIYKIAATHGYETQATFSRAFKDMFHSSPKDFRKQGIKSLYPDPFSYTTAPIEEPVIVKVSPLKIIGFSKIRKIGEQDTSLLEDFFLYGEKNNLSCDDKNIFILTKYLHQNRITPGETYISFIGCDINTVEALPKNINIRKMPENNYVMFTYKRDCFDLMKIYNYINLWETESRLKLDKNVQYINIQKDFAQTNMIRILYQIES